MTARRQATPRILMSSRTTRVRHSPMVPRGSLVQVAPAAFAHASEWNALFSEAKLRGLAIAAVARMRGSAGVLSGAVAGSMHRLPLYKVRSDRVDMIFAGVRGRRSTSHVRRHFIDLPAEDVVEVDGLRVTNLERTVYDLIRLLSLEAAVVVFDAALRLVAWNDDDNTFDIAAAQKFRNSVRSRVSANAGARGIRQARFVTDFADGRAQLPGESVARLWMAQLELPPPALQYRVEFDDGSYALLDFAWTQLRRWLEFDGAFKLTDPDLLEGRSAEEVLRAQAWRESRIRAATGWHCDHFSFDAMGTIDEFAAYLRRIGMYPAPPAS